MEAISTKDNAYREMYNLLVDFELKISELSRFIRIQKKRKKPNLTQANEINRLKLHRKLLKSNLKFVKKATDKQWRKNREEIQSIFKKAKKAFKKSNDALSGKKDKK